MLPYMHALRHSFVNWLPITRANGPRQIRTKWPSFSNGRSIATADQADDSEPELTTVDYALAEEAALAERLERTRLLNFDTAAGITPPRKSKHTLQRSKRPWGSSGSGSPTASLLELLRQVDPVEEKKHKPHVARAVQRNRLPAVAHHFLLQQQQQKNHSEDDAHHLEDSVAWVKRLDYLRGTRGVTESDLEHWLWILEAETPDVQVDRLLSSDRPKPIFVLLAILRTDNIFSDGQSLIRLYEYIVRTYMRPPNSADQKESADSTPKEGPPLGVEDKLAPSPHFLTIIARLVHHCSATFPASMPMIARLVVTFLETIPSDRGPKKQSKRTGYADRCMVFNFALQRFRQTTGALRGSPLAHLPENWSAQKVLLAYSAGLERPLIIDRLSFTSIRIVLLGLKKTEAEKMAAIRHAKTWPPYVKPLDGTDEARDPEEYFSRSVKAGVLKRSEGYADDSSDKVLDILGGAKPGTFVTIHTRSSDLGHWPKQWRSLRVFTEWAAKVKATRDIYEAWRMFHDPPLPGLKPNFTVYHEMFAKLFAREASNPSIVPGEAKETYPPYIANLTEFELARTSPCSPDELYERMLQDGNRPVNQCLALLIRHAPSLERAAEILHDSPIPTAAVDDLTLNDKPRYANLRHVPIAVFADYIALLCRLQGRQRWAPTSWWRSTGGRLAPDVAARYSRLDRAIKLVNTRLGGRRQPGAHPWHIVMRALARNQLVFMPSARQDFDDLGALLRMLPLFKTYWRVQGSCVVAFDCLVRCVLKLCINEPQGTAQQQAKTEQLLTQASGVLETAFDELTRPVKQAVQDPSSPILDKEPSIYHEFSSAHIQTYLELLTRQCDVEQAVKVMDWVLSAWELGPDVLRKARHPQHKQFAMMRQAIACFRGFVEEVDVPPETIEKIRQRFAELEEKGVPWTWPEDEEMDEYYS